MKRIHYNVGKQYHKNLLPERGIHMNVEKAIKLEKRKYKIQVLTNVLI